MAGHRDVWVVVELVVFAFFLGEFLIAQLWIRGVHKVMRSFVSLLSLAAVTAAIVQFLAAGLDPVKDGHLKRGQKDLMHYSLCVQSVRLVVAVTFFPVRAPCVS